MKQMQTDFFFVAPSESMLTGLCLEEYLLLRQANGTTSFFQVSHARIDPFMPNLMGIRRTKINETDIPDDLEWLPIEDMRIGRRASEPNTFYGIDEQGAYRKKIQRRGGFLNLLQCYLIPHLGVADWMRPLMERASHDNLDMAALAADMLPEIIHNGYHDPARIGIKSEDDKPAEIEKAIVSLVEYNEMQRFFSMGRSFGRMIGGLQLYERDYNSLISFSSIGKSLCDLIDVPEIERSAVAKNALASIADVFEPEREAFEPVLKLIVRCVEGDQPILARLAGIAEELSDEERTALARALKDSGGTRTTRSGSPFGTTSVACRMGGFWGDSWSNP